MHEQIEIEQDVENDRADDHQHERTCLRASRARRCDGSDYAVPLARGSASSPVARLSRMRHWRDILQIFQKQQPRGGGIRPPGSGRSFPSPPGTAPASTLRKLMADLGHRARHVVVRRHHDQRAEAALLAPSAGSRSALPSVLSERSKSTQQRTTRRIRGLRREISLRVGRAVDAADEQPLAAPGRQELDRIVMREAPPVSTTMPSALRSSTTSSAGSRPDEPEEAERQQQRTAARKTRPSAGRCAAKAGLPATAPPQDRSSGVSFGL